MPVDFCDERARVRGITLPRNYDLARRAQREIESDQHLGHRTWEVSDLRGKSLDRFFGTGESARVIPDLSET